MLAEFYGDLAEKLNLNSQNSVQYISELTHCRTSPIYQMAQKKSKRFTIPEPELFEAVFRITYFGKQILDKFLDSASQISTIENSYSVLGKKLC